jgi:hypothetical protein
MSYCQHIIIGRNKLEFKNMTAKFTVLIAMASIFIYSCKKDNDTGSNSIAPIPIQIDSFPLTIGNLWKYHTDITVFDSIGQVSMTYEYEHFWNVISDTIINGWNATKIQQIDSNYNGTVNVGFTYYANRPDGFYAVASENFGSMFNLKSTNFKLFPSNDMTINSQADSIFIPTAPLQFLKFPSSLNDSWDVLTYIDTTILYQNRVYTNFQTVNTNAGTFDCIRLKANQEENGILDTTITIYQDVAEKGLIRETWYADLLFSGGGTGTMVRTSTLVQINF